MADKTAFRLDGDATSFKVAQALAKITKKTVVCCASIGDAACHVWLVYPVRPERQIGQAADYRHDVAAYAERQGHLSVIGWWDENDGWCCTISTDDATVVREISRQLGIKTIAEIRAAEARRAEQLQRDWERWQAEAPEREARRADRQRRIAEAQERLRPLYEAAKAKIPLNRHGRPRGDLLDKLDYCWHLATDCGYAEDVRRGEEALAEYAANGMV